MSPLSEFYHHRRRETNTYCVLYFMPLPFPGPIATYILICLLIEIKENCVILPLWITVAFETSKMHIYLLPSECFI